VGHLGAVFYRFTMPRLTNAQKQENYRKRKKEAEEGSHRPKKIANIQLVGVTFYVQFAVQS
jgi:predicted histidine transporter YuiF (NhaC family)